MKRLLRSGARRSSSSRLLSSVSAVATAVLLPFVHPHLSKEGRRQCITTSIMKRRSPRRSARSGSSTTCCGADQELDFSRNFMPESLARTAALDGAQPVRAAHPQPDQRAPVSEHLRDRRGVHPSVPGRSCAAASSRRRLAGSRDPQFRERGSQAHPPVQALPRSVRPRLPGRMPGDRPVRSDRRGSARATIRSRSASSS